MRYTTTGKAVANFTLAVDRRFGGPDKETDYFDIVCWQNLAETVANHLGKGRMTGVEGRGQITSYEKDGQKRKKFEVVADNVVFLDRPPQDNG